MHHGCPNLNHFCKDWKRPKTIGFSSSPFYWEKNPKMICAPNVLLENVLSSFFLNYQLKIAVLWLDQNVGHFLLDLRLWVFLVAKQKGPGLCRSTLGIFSINIHNLGDNTPGGVAAFIRNFGEEKCRAGLVGILQKNGDCLTKQPVSKISSPNKKSKSWYKRRRMWYNNLPP